MTPNTHDSAMRAGITDDDPHAQADCPLCGHRLGGEKVEAVTTWIDRQWMHNR